MKLRALIAAALVTFAVTGAAMADDESDALAARGKAKRYSLKTTDPKNSIDTGGAAILVNAPIADVRRMVTAYKDYAKFIKPFEQSRLISRKNGVSEVYLEVPILNGAAKIWAVVNISSPEKDGSGDNAGEKIVARYSGKGNVDDFRAVWRLRSIDDDHTVVKLEILVDPKIPVPASMITPELSYAADKAVTAVRDRAEGRTDRDGKRPSNVAKR